MISTFYNKIMNKLTEKWRVTGLLDGLINETTCDKLAGYLDTVATRLIKEKNSEQLCGIMIPIVRRVYDRVPPDKFPLVDWLYDDCKKWVDGHKKLLERLMNESYNKIDGEAEFVALYTDDVVNRILLVGEVKYGH